MGVEPGSERGQFSALCFDETRTPHNRYRLQFHHGQQISSFCTGKSQQGLAGSTCPGSRGLSRIHPCSITTVTHLHGDTDY